MNASRRSGVTAAFIFIGRFATIIFNVAIIVLVTRYLGKTVFGQYAFVESYTLVLSTLATGGTSTILIREIAKHRESANKSLGTALQIQLLFALLAFALGIIILPLFNDDPLMTRAVYVSAFASIIQVFANLYGCIFIAYERTKFWALTTIVERIVYSALVAVAILSGSGLIVIFWMKVLSFSIKLLLNAVIVGRRFTRTTWRSDFGAARYFARESFPLVFSDTFLSLDRQMDALLLQLWSSVTQIGVFSAPYRIIDRMIILPDSIMSGFLPALSRMQVIDREALHDLYRKIFKFFLLIALPVAVLGTLLAKPIVVLLFTQEYLDSVPVLQLLVWIVLCMFPNYLFKYVLTAIGRQRYDTFSRFVSVSVHLLLGWLLIPQRGAMGAAIAALSSQVILLIIGYTYVSINLHAYRPYALLLKLGGATLVAFLLLRSLADASLFISLPLGIAVYLSGYVLLRIVNAQELQIMWEMMGTRRQKPAGPSSL